MGLACSVLMPRPGVWTGAWLQIAAPRVHREMPSSDNRSRMLLVFDLVGV